MVLASGLPILSSASTSSASWGALLASAISRTHASSVAAPSDRMTQGRARRDKWRQGNSRLRGTRPKPFPVTFVEVLPPARRPRHVVPAIIGRQEDAARLVVRGDDHAADIEDGVIPQVLLIDAQHIGRARRVGFVVMIRHHGHDHRPIRSARATFMRCGFCPRDMRLRRWRNCCRSRRGGCGRWSGATTRADPRRSATSASATARADDPDARGAGCA